MAGRKSAVDAMPAVRREELMADIMRGVMTWRALGKKFGIAQSTIRAFADRHQIQRNPTGAKREMVAAKMAAATPDVVEEPAGSGADAARPAHPAHPIPAHDAGKPAQRAAMAPTAAQSELEAAADEDVRDMRYGLQAARMALSIVGKKLKLGVVQHTTLAPRDVKILSETIAVNIATIRSIRGLDAPPPDLSSLTDEQLAALAEGKKIG